MAEEAARVFKAHATLLGGEFPNNDLGGFTPQVYVALSAREVDAEGAHGGALPLAGLRRPAVPRRRRWCARWRGCAARRSAKPAAEAFAVVGRVVVRADGMTTTMATTAARAPSVTVLVAALQRGAGDRRCGARRAARRAVGEVLVVDDGSTDGTDRAAADAGARVLRLPANGGKGSAVRRGLSEVRGEVDRADRRRRPGRPGGDPAPAGGAASRRRSGRRLALHRPLRAGRDHAGQPLGQPLPHRR